MEAAHRIKDSVYSSAHLHILKLHSGYSRPHLGSLFGDDGKADLVIVETDPGQLTKGMQRGGKLYLIRQYMHRETCVKGSYKLMNVLMFLTEALNLILAAGGVQVVKGRCVLLQ